MKDTAAASSLTPGPLPPSLLHYRPWRGQFHSPFASVWPIARISLRMILRRKLFWVLYAFALTIFLMFFFGQYLLAWAQTQAGETTVTVGMVRTQPGQLIGLLRDILKLNGRAEMYRNFIWWQGYMVMIVLALAGSVLVGNDFHFGSLPFYLSKPLGRWHYLIGKCLAVATFVNMMTTVPALALFVQYGLLDSYDYFLQDGFSLGSLAIGDIDVHFQLPNPLMFGIIGYGLILSICMSLLLVATAVWLRRTVPMIMVWTALFFFFRLIAATLVDGLRYDSRWRLMDIWNDIYLVGSACLGMPFTSLRSSRQPAVMEAALVLGALCLLCLSYLNRRIRAVEIVR
jgi:hypothetical protein